VPSDLIYDKICLAEILKSILSRNLYERYPKDIEFQNYDFEFLFFDPIIQNQNALRLVPRGNLLTKIKQKGDLTIKLLVKV
jgi:hypothetical protein